MAIHYLDSIIEDYVGPNGRWQITVFILGSLLPIASGIATFLSSFTAYLPSKFRCLIPECEGKIQDPIFDAPFASFAIPKWNETDNVYERRCLAYTSSTGKCGPDAFDTTILIPCEKHVYDTSQYPTSFVMELDIPPCDDMDDGWPLKPAVNKIQFIGFAFMLGHLVGSFVTGIICDKFGRKKTLFGSLLFSTISVLVGYWSNDLLSYFFARFLTGVFDKSLFTIMFIILIEIVGTKYRTFYALCINFPFAIGEILLGLLAFLIQDWRFLHAAAAGVLILALSLWFIIPESPRWLVSKERYEEAKKIFSQGAKWNKNYIPNEVLEKLSAKNSEHSKPKPHLGVASLFSNATIAKITLVMSYVWICSVLSYYGLSMIAVNIGGDIYLNFILSGVVEIPSYIACLLVIDRWGRKASVIACLILSGSTCIIAGVVTNELVRIICSLIGKFGASALLGIIYLYTAELYPTEVRNTGIGINSGLARLGSIAAPFVATLQTFSIFIPYAIMGTLSLIGGLLALLLPETLGSELPESFEDVEALYSKNNNFFGCSQKGNKENRSLHNSYKKPSLPKFEKDFAIPQIVVQAPTPILSASVSKKQAILPEDEVEHTNGGFEGDDLPQTHETNKQNSGRDDEKKSLSTEEEEANNVANTPCTTKPSCNTVLGHSNPNDKIEDCLSSQSNVEDRSPSKDTIKDSSPSLNKIEDCSTSQGTVEECSASRDTIENCSLSQDKAEEDYSAPQNKIEDTSLPPETDPPSLKNPVSKNETSDNDTDQKKLENSERFRKPSVKELVSNFTTMDSNDRKIAGPTLSLPKGASRKFSQLSPAPMDSPEAKRIGNFVMIPTLKADQ